MASVSTNLRDVNFSFENSCNCCRWLLCCFTPKEPQVVHVNKHGNLEPYCAKKDKGDSGMASIERIEFIVKDRFEHDLRDTHMLLEEFQRRADINFEALKRAPSPLTMKKVHSINRALFELINEGRELDEAKL